MIFVLLFVLSAVLTYLIKIYAVKKSIIDIPNERSSHEIPTPRGGGLAVIITFYIGLFYFKDTLEPKLFYALLCSFPIVVISLIDDIVSLSSKVRFIVQLLSASLALWFLGGVNKIDFVLFELSGWWINIFVLVAIVWITNLYNFLDGIDGYAGSEAVTVGIGLFLLLGNDLGMVIASGTLGFLIFNWHKASIFMGDVGSATLGFVFAILVFSDTSNGNIYIWLILLSVFWVDATVTIFRRWKNGEPLTKAHKKHVYQRLFQSGFSHSYITFGLLGINMIFIGLLLISSKNFYPYIFLLNIILLFAIIKFTDKRKSFYHD